MDNLITISVPTFQRPDLLLTALNSCFAQDYRPLEIDIGDNSTDQETERMVAGLIPPVGITIRYRRHVPGLGQVGNMQELLARARGDRLLLLHDDDLLLPGAITTMAAAYDLAPDVVLSYGTLQHIDARGQYLQKMTEKENADLGRTFEHAGLRRDLLVAALRRHVLPLGFLVRADAAKRVSFRNRDEIGLAVDTDFSIRLALAYPDAAFAFVAQPVYQFRLWAESQRFTQHDTCWKLYDKVLALEGLSLEEEKARDALLTFIARAATTENALGGRRRAALRILLSRHYPRNEDLLRRAYTLCLLLMPRLAYAVRRLIPVSFATPSISGSTPPRVGTH